jgi:2-polyprenyl-3-methyl-5-hydroxy-6-metoxy-1,4-benzoquinol methylase
MSKAVEDEDGNFSDWESDNEEELPVKSLFSDVILPTIEILFEHDLNNHNFDLRTMANTMGNDDVSLIKLINFIRYQVNKQNGNITTQFIEELQNEILSKEFLNNDLYMKVVLQEDPLLFSLREAMGVEFEDDEDFENKSNNKIVNTESQSTEMIEEMKRIVKNVTSDEVSNDPQDDKYYFDGYSHLGIHETMLRDSSRTNAYAEALLSNSDYLKGKVVLDVGCGTGILSMLAAKAGAKKVVGIDLSSIIEKSKEVVKRNGYENIITLVRGRLETTELPLALGEVDIIVSEWMGYGLYFENMLTSVIYARDKYLKNTGILMPSKAEIYFEAMSAGGEDDRVGWWRDVYGFDMRDLEDLQTIEAAVQTVDSNHICSQRHLIHNLDIGIADDDDLDFDAPFKLNISKDCNLNSFVITFDTPFTATGFNNEVILTTASQSQYTHWKQTVLWLNPSNCCKVNIDSVVTGVVKYIRSEENSRDYKIEVVWSIMSKDMLTIVQKEKSQMFILAA